MNIIKPGTNNGGASGNTQVAQNKEFECPNCGCIFIANRSEFDCIKTSNFTTYTCSCPSCSKLVYGSIMDVEYTANNSGGSTPSQHIAPNLNDTDYIIEGNVINPGGAVSN